MVPSSKRVPRCLLQKRIYCGIKGPTGTTGSNTAIANYRRRALLVGRAVRGPEIREAGRSDAVS